MEVFSIASRALEGRRRVAGASSGARGVCRRLRCSSISGVRLLPDDVRRPL
jgi:hypothetical protein